MEHRLFSLISFNRRGKPLRDYDAVARLIAYTTTAKRLTVRCRVDRRKYKLSQDFSPNRFYGEWYCVFHPGGAHSL